MEIEVIAPAKLNLTLEITGKREDGYHEVRTLMQTINLVDRVRLQPAESIEVVLEGDDAADIEDEDNLAYRAAVALREAAGLESVGVHITVEKNIPAAGGLGGGSSDAAAVLRGLNLLWGLDWDTTRLAGVAASLGSDVTFFLHGGTAVCRGRGEVVQPLPEAQLGWLPGFVSDARISDKTKRMYRQVTADDYTPGAITNRAALKVEEGIPLDLSDFLNVFDEHIGAVAASSARAMQLCLEAELPVYAAGSGPSFFSPAPYTALTDALVAGLEGLGISIFAVDALTREEALALTVRG